MTLSTTRQNLTKSSMKRKRHPRKKNNKIKRIFAVISFSIIVALAGYGVFQLVRTVISQFTHPAEAPMVTREYITPKVKFDGNYKTAFDDIQEVQIEAATSRGITPLEDASDIGNQLRNKKLVQVGNDSSYDCQADYPYLVPIAAELLEEIRKRYQAAEGNDKQLRLTGCLRTIKSVKGLKRWNPNSVENSCHLYGTTIDISYAKMTQKEKKALGQVLYELQQAGYCYVKYERKQPCFHITVRRGPDIIETEK